MTVGGWSANCFGLLPPPQQDDQFVVDDLDNLLSRGQTLEHVVPDRLLLDFLDETPGYLEVYVGFQQ